MKYSELNKRNFDTKNVTAVPLSGTCVKCKNKYQYSNISKFMRNRKDKENLKNLWNTCQKCWFIINTKESTQWIKKNSESQKIAQNKPSQIQKNRDGVRKSWDDKRRKRASKILKEKWKNDEAFAKKALKNLCYNNIKIGFGSGGLKGEYNNIYYDSGLELSFIIWCKRNDIDIIRFDKDPIEYIDENNNIRKYYPDFIINNNEVVEIKGSGLWYRKNYERNILKHNAAKKAFNCYRQIFETDECVKKYYNTARKIHNETYKKNTN